jgi:hypothetical protein
LPARPAFFHRRPVAAALALGLLATACTKGGGAQTSIATLKRGALKYSLVQAQSALAPGSSRFAFGLYPPNGALKVGGTPQVWVAKDEKARPLGPFPARWVTWSPPRGDATGKPPIPGFYVADVTLPGPGNWMILAKDVVDGKPIAAQAAMPAAAKPVAAIGSPAISEPTPVATTPEEAAKMDTRDPPTPMHYISLDAALRNRLPTVLAFATPLLCQSRLCGPVVDEVLGVYERVGRARANFVDVEIYPQRDAEKPAPEFLRWGFESEPWVIVIDRDGIIRGGFEGPVVGSEVEAALDPLLPAA